MNVSAADELSYRRLAFDFFALTIVTDTTFSLDCVSLITAVETAFKQSWEPTYSHEPIQEKIDEVFGQVRFRIKDLGLCR